MKQVSRIQHPLTVGVVAVGLASSAMPASSQQSDQAPAALEEIVVTAQRREEKLNSVPISVSALSEAHLEQMGAKDIEGFAREVPGLSVQPATNGGAPAIAIRGISSAAGDATVGVYIDDTPVQAPKSSFSADPMPKLFDIDRVEVLRGPQGTLFGSSSEGGTIRYITPTPSLTDFSGKVRSEVAFTESGAPSYEVGAAAGGPAIDGASGIARFGLLPPRRRIHRPDIAAHGRCDRLQCEPFRLGVSSAGGEPGLTRWTSGPARRLLSTATQRSPATYLFDIGTLPAGQHSALAGR